MSIEYVLYFIDLINKLSEFSKCIFICSMITIIGCSFYYMMNADFKWVSKEYALKICKKFYKVCLFFIISSLIFILVIPSEKTIYAIALTHYSKQSEIPAKVLKAIEVKLDEIIEGKVK